MKLKKNDEFELSITDMSDEGLGIGRYEDFIWFVKGGIVGDTVLCGVTKLKKNYGYARLIRVITPSKDRREPACAVSGRCGGCQLQQLDYRAQLRLKTDKVANALMRIGGFTREQVDGVLRPIIAAEMPLRYRNKAQFPIGRDREGRLVAGFYAGRTHSIIDCEDCLLGAEENKYLLDAVLKWMKECGLEPYDEKSHKGLVRHVLLRKSRENEEFMICLVINKKVLPERDRLISLLLDCSREHGLKIGSISYSSNTKDTNVILGEGYETIYGLPYIEDVIRCTDSIKEDTDIEKEDANIENRISQGIRFRISPLSFYQVNPFQTERLYAEALSLAELTGRETVWDLYCGIGTISLFLARSAGRVYGVEVVPQAIEDARANAKLNDIENAEFFTGKAEEVLPAWYAEHADEEGGMAHPDVIVVDPPRKGCDEACLDTMVRMAPSRIVYVSCNPATLARDLRYLCDRGYELRAVRPCDMFPQTVHCECAVKLERRG